MKKIILILLFITTSGCNGTSSAPTPKKEIEIKYNECVIHVKKKEVITLSQSGMFSQFRQQMVIVDHNGTEYRFNFYNENTHNFNEFQIGKKYRVYYYRGNINKIEEIQ